jgi:general secretion pathway protein C
MMARLDNWFRHGGAATILEFVLVALLGIALAHWTWVAISPRPVAASSFQGADGEARGAAAPVKRNLFGFAQDGTSAIADAPPSSSVKVLGVIARAGRGNGRAILALDSGKVREVEAGWQISPGLVLKEVHPDYVILARNGVPERIRLNRRAAAAK